VKVFHNEKYTRVEYEERTSLIHLFKQMLILILVILIIILITYIMVHNIFN